MVRKRDLLILVLSLSICIVLWGCDIEVGLVGLPGGSGGLPASACFDYWDIDTTVSFDASCSTASDGLLVSYSWNLGDGSFAAGKKVMHEYEERGCYTVTLTVRTNQNVTSQYSKHVPVGIEGPSCGTVWAIFYEPFQYDVPDADDMSDLNSEYVTIGINLCPSWQLCPSTPATIDLSEVELHSATGHVFKFPVGSVAEDGDLVRVHTGRGINTESDFYWNLDSEVWLNHGGRAWLVLPNARHVTDTYEYGAAFVFTGDTSLPYYLWPFDRE